MSDSHDHGGARHGGLSDDELLAAEYALGVLTKPERDEAERRIARDHAFASHAAEWGQRLAPWAAEISAVPPPPHVWERIVASLPAQPTPRASLWRSLALWRGLAAAGGLLAAACIAALVYVGNVRSQGQLVASLAGGGKIAFVASIDPQRATVIVIPAGLSIAADRVPELWLIRPGAKPRALGLLDADKPVALAIPKNLREEATTQAVLAVSLEPPGGSPTGQATGPVIASGKLTKL
jgi:anti-sigma-K factor RskA